MFRETMSRHTDSTDISMRKIGTAGLTRQHLNEHGITRDEGAFLRAVVKAVNRDLDGYSLIDSMTNIKSKYDIDEDKLIEQGQLKKHSGVARRVYYSVCPAGQEACRTTKEHGFMIGDRGDDTPHRVGVELTRRYFEARDEVRFCEISSREDGSRNDLAVINTDFERIATVEVEGGRVSADYGFEEGMKSGINDYDSIRHDYRVLAAADGESVWVVRNHEIAANVLRALNAGNEIDVHVPHDTIRGIESTRVKVGEFNDELETQGNGLDRFLTFQQLRNML